MKRIMHSLLGVLTGSLIWLGAVVPAHSEAMLQYFNTSWVELAHKIPELAEAGYNSIWLPPPQKGGGGLSVGYDHWDPFDFGSVDQRGSVRTRYGTEADLFHLIRIAHRFGIRLYFDNIMNHRAFDVPGYNEATPLDVYPGMRPEDFHLRLTEEGFYRKWDNTRDWNDAWQVMNLGLSDLIDIAHETHFRDAQGRALNDNFGTNEGDDFPKISFVRHPDQSAYYLDTDLPIEVTNPSTQIDFNVFTFADKEPYQDTGLDGIPGSHDTGEGDGRFSWTDGNGNGQHDAGEASEPFDDTGLDPTRPGAVWQSADRGYGDGIYNMGNPVSEDVGAYLIRAAAWVMDHTAVDGLRLDAVKHIPDYFFGAFNDDVSDAGYLGAVQRQFNITRGYSDWDNHRDTVFDEEAPRDDAMLFGEHLGEPPGYGGYIAAGMRLVDNLLRNELNGRLGNPSAGLQGLDGAGGGGFASSVSVSHAQSHDNDYAAQKELQHAFYFTRRNLPLVYTDGNYQAETLGQSGGAFPRHANTRFLGQFGDSRLPNLMTLHNHMARGEQVGRWADADVLAYERRDWSEVSTGQAADAVTLAFMLNDNSAQGQYRDIPTSYPDGAYLYNYADAKSRDDNGFYHTVSDGSISVIVPRGGYFAFGWRSPEASRLWRRGGGDPVTIYQDGAPAESVRYERRDGSDGDPGFNPYGVDDPDATDFAYSWQVPRVTSGDDLDFVARVDGSAINVLFKLDNGVDLNGASHAEGDPRDHPPALSPDWKLGFEAADFVHRQHGEKFAAASVSRNVIGSLGAETYQATIGSSGFTVANGSGANGYDQTAVWVYHNPSAQNDQATAQFLPLPEQAAGQDVEIWVKTGYQHDINRVFLYYTVDGTHNPEGAGGAGIGTTRAVEMFFHHNGSPDGTGTPDWWRGTIPGADLADGTELRYKIGAFSQQNGSGSHPWDVVFPGNEETVARKKNMMGVWQVDGFNARTASYRPHGDYGSMETGLEDGFHFLQARAFLDRSGRSSVYNTFPQTFYLDLETPQGDIAYPAESDTVRGEYGMVIRTDRTVHRVLVHIEDSDAANDDSSTGQANGNGIGTNGWAWVDASAVEAQTGIDSTYPLEWRFPYRNIPSTGSAAIEVRFLEISSSDDTSRSPAEGHYGRLVRNVSTASDPVTFTIAWPRDNDTVNSNYVMKVQFSDGLDPAGIVIDIDGVTQGADRFSLADLGAGLRELRYTLPDLWNGVADFVHEIRATYTPPGGGVSRSSTRYVFAERTAEGLFIEITHPREFDSDGQPNVLTLPDLAPADLGPDDRRTTIQVETGLEAEQVWLTFDTNGFTTGTAELLPEVATRLSGSGAAVFGSRRVDGIDRVLTGTVSATNGSTRISGVGTQFETELQPGQIIRLAGEDQVVTQVLSQTELELGLPRAGSTVQGAALLLPPAFFTELNPGDTVRVGAREGLVSQVVSDVALDLADTYPDPTATGLDLFRISDSPVVVGSRKLWSFDWTHITEGTYRFTAAANTQAPDRSATNGLASRVIRVVFREQVPPDADDEDDDDDGLLDVEESSTYLLPDTNAETWTNRDVKAWASLGHSDPLGPDTDGDGLPDGLESGWRTLDIDPTETDVSTDTNGDGFPNFLPDLDPPFYNTVPDNSNVPGYDFNGSRTQLLGGTRTDPARADTDGDGLPDGIEDANRNGWVDGDGDPVPGHYLDPNFTFGGDPRTWPDGRLDPGDPWVETDPNQEDSDGDGAADGYGEDTDLNGRIAGDANTNRVAELGEAWSETDPLNPDTDGDGLPDGWESRYDLDPLDNGLDSLRTPTGMDGLPEMGGGGNPDGDVIVENGVTNEYTNLLEFQNGTHPRQANTATAPPPGRIVIGPGPVLGELDGESVYEEFRDWTAADCLVLDEIEGDGTNNQGGDVFLGYDGHDTSRDLVAFYARDGGEPGSGGDGLFYFRADFYDLRTYAEEGHLNLYIVIDTGEEDDGERVLPDEVDTLTNLRWEAVVAVYDSASGRVYIDGDKTRDTSRLGQDLVADGGVEVAAGGFVDAYFNRKLDAVEIAISRQALRDAGWNGFNAADLRYQVYTTRDGTGNTPPGDGDIGGRSDIRDSIYDDWIAEDYYYSQAGLNSVLTSWFSGARRAGRAKVASVIHGSQALVPGSEAQDLIHNEDDAGYYRPVESHALFEEPVGLHLTAALASSLAWAAADPGAGAPERDGPAFNARIGDLVNTHLITLLGSTFSDHLLPYFTPDMNRDNEQLARSFLEQIYTTQIDPSRAVFWIPERAMDADVLGKVKDMGYGHTLVDQMIHLRHWFGRETALGNDGYRLNRVHGVTCFAIHEQATGFRFRNDDSGLALPLRRLFNRKARSGTQDQVVTLFSTWEDFEDPGQADAYDTNLRWMANRPWVLNVAHEQIIRGEIDVTGDGVGDGLTNGWYVIDRGVPSLPRLAQDFVQHASEDDVDHWYQGSAQEESLQAKIFNIRPGTPVHAAYGSPVDGGLVRQAWEAVDGIVETNLGVIARGAYHASLFQTAFHDEDNLNLSKFSTGEYVYPDTSYDELAGFSKTAQSQTRLAALYDRVDTWARLARYGDPVRTESLDVDLDGEDEYLLYNGRLIGLFERTGGRLVGVWARSVLTGRPVQVVGNPLSYAGSETEEEGAENIAPDGSVAAYRTSCLKDWQAIPSGDESQYVNGLYGFTDQGDRWVIVSSDGKVRKTVSLAPGADAFEVAYQLTGLSRLSVRNGLTPHLGDLLVNGQRTLGAEMHGGGIMSLSNTSYVDTVTARVGYSDAGHQALFHLAATDQPSEGEGFDTRNMRNQAQTHQVEISGQAAFAFSLGFHTEPSDYDADGLPNTIEDLEPFLNPRDPSDADKDQDGDGISNTGEYTAGTGLDDAGSYPNLSSQWLTPDGMQIRFATETDRLYQVWYTDDDLSHPVWKPALADPVLGTGGVVIWTDDGTSTSPPPSDPAVRHRVYRTEVSLPN